MSAALNRATVVPSSAAISYVTRAFEPEKQRGTMKLTDGRDCRRIRSIHVPPAERSWGRGVTARRFRAAFALGVALCFATALPLAVQALPGDVDPTAGVAGETDGSSSQWVTRPPLRQARGGLGVATVDGQILAISGFDFKGLYDVVEARPQTGTGSWHDLAPCRPPAPTWPPPSWAGWCTRSEVIAGGARAN